MRSLRQVVIGTTISGSLIDKRARDNFAYVILMKPKKPYDHIFGQNKGVRMGDLRGVYRNELNDQIRFPRIKGKEHGNNVVYNNIYCFPPGEDLLKYYNEFRESEAERLRQIAGNEQPHQETKKQKNSYILTCPKCFKTDIRYSRKEKISYCRTCGTIIKTDGGENGAPSAY